MRHGSVTRIEDLHSGYFDVVSYVLDYGSKSAPRGQATTEVLDAVILIENPRGPQLPVGVRKGVKPAIGAAEALQLIGGFSDPAMMVRIAANFGNFRDAGSFHGAYGPRIRHQLPLIETKLKSDADSRQAVLSIWDYGRDLTADDVPRDLPCTLSIQLFLREDKLFMSVNMRSNDVVWGLSYDIFQFTQLQLSLAAALGVEAGSYAHHSASLHIYDRDHGVLQATAKQASPPRPQGVAASPTANGVVGMMRSAREIYYGSVGVNRCERWYADVLRSYLPAAA